MDKMITEKTLMYLFDKAQTADVQADILKLFVNNNPNKIIPPQAKTVITTSKIDVYAYCKKLGSARQTPKRIEQYTKIIEKVAEKGGKIEESAIDQYVSRDAALRKNLFVKEGNFLILKSIEDIKPLGGQYKSNKHQDLDENELPDGPHPKGLFGR